MSNCYTCPVQGEIENLRKRCLACNIKHKDCGLSNGGKRWVHFESTPRPETITRGRVHPLFSKENTETKLDTPLNDGERMNLLRILRIFADLGYYQGGLICAMMGGMTLEQVSKKVGVSVQALHQRWVQATQKFPELLALANGSIGSGRGRKKAVPIAQTDLFANGGAAHGRA